jgi:hypothetical protein
MPRDKEMPADPLLITHEDRITKLEDHQSEVKSDIAVLTQRVEDGFKLLVEKVDDFRTELRNHAAEDKVTATKVDKIASQVDAIESKSRKRKERWSSLGKYAWALILVVLGAAAKFGFDMLKH